MWGDSDCPVYFTTFSGLNLCEFEQVQVRVDMQHDAATRCLWRVILACHTSEILLTHFLSSIVAGWWRKKCSRWEEGRYTLFKTRSKDIEGPYIMWYRLHFISKISSVDQLMSVCIALPTRHGWRQLTVDVKSIRRSVKLKWNLKKNYKKGKTNQFRMFFSYCFHVSIVEAWSFPFLHLFNCLPDVLFIIPPHFLSKCQQNQACFCFSLLVVLNCAFFYILFVFFSNSFNFSHIIIPKCNIFNFRTTIII